MNAKEIKSALKEAREAIKNKDYNKSLQICKAILKADRNNYVGLVLFGVSLQETDKKSQAPNAFNKAIELSPKQPLAWQGLASYYEKDDSKESQKALLNVYAQLLSLESDLNKFSDLCSKLAVTAQKIEEEETCINILERQEQVSTLEQQRVIWSTVMSIVSLKDLTPRLSDALESALSKVINDVTFEDIVEYYKIYLKLLHKRKKYIDLLDAARKMHSLYPDMEYPLEWICRAYSELIVINDEAAKMVKNDIKEYYDKLTTLSSNSSMVLLAKGAELYLNASYTESCEILKQVLGVMPNSCHIWALLCQCYIHTHCYVDAECCAIEGLKLLTKTSSEDPFLVMMLKLILIKSLSHQKDPKKLEDAIEKGKEFLAVYHGNMDVIACLARAYIASDRLEEAGKCISVVEDSEQHHATAMLLAALKFKKEGCLSEAEEQLEYAVSKEPLDSELWLELGKLLWEQGRRDESLPVFLKATKLDPNCYTCFVYLGHYYRHIGQDLDKARRCYQKAFQLNARDEEAGAGLSDIYRIQKHTELNVQLLSYVTQKYGPIAAKWAWLRLGLHYIEQGNHQEAINSLRAAIRGDPNDSHCWESLADAYFARGSYTAALKSYQRVVELNPDALYPAFQVAGIKMLIGDFEESVAEYRMVVASNPKYVPGLKGLAEACLASARFSLSQQLLGRCRDLCQEAVDALTRALEDHRGLSCLWKLMGDACTMMTNLPDGNAELNVQRWLVHSTPDAEEEEDTTLQLLSKTGALQLGARCFCRALSITPNISLLWHDLAVNYHYQANSSTNAQLKKQIRDWALIAAKKSITLSPRNWHHWNILGVVAATNEIRNLKLAQHCFIKSLELVSNNPVSWTNLGTIYLILGEIILANAAFRASQRIEPEYIEAWIGQALLAESIEHRDAMDLFRHTTSLGVHRESCLGYSHWVCSTLLSSEDKTDPNYIYSIEKLHAVTVAGDSMTWYTTTYPNDAHALNIYGLLMERQKLYNLAGAAFARALKLLEGEKNPELPDKVRCNYGRILVQLQKYDEAIQCYREIRQASFVSQCGLALAYFKAEKYQDSYNAYETILHWLAPDDGLKSHVLVAMAAMAYIFQGVEDSKTLLFQCVQLKPPSVPGLFASCALGMLHGDLNLSEMVLKELVPHKDNPQYITHIAVFKAYAHTLQNRSIEAIRSLCSTVHRHPGEASSWLALALLILNLYPNCQPSGAARCAQLAMSLGRGTMDVSKVMSLVSLSHLLAGKATPSLRSSQKAVHMFPDIPENWVVLIASFLPWCMAKHSVKDVLHLKDLIGHVRRKMDPTKVTRQMAKWLSSHERRVAILAEEFSKQH
ncbi:tetratricopeptide repeat protein 37 [Anabrus simplex]|uniref:tetratricopeptide repeat protein 37 n=1 Tax=Anabrus simplex TaxID=316456 RepID=UPI0034DD823C